jgi:opacity protein-like surface antigen
MNRTLRAVLPALAALTLGAAASAAQTIPSPYQYIERGRSLTVYGGYLLTGPKVALADSQSAELGHQPAPLVGVRYSMRVGGPLSLEANVAYSPTQRRLYTAVVNADSSAVTVNPTGDEVSDPLLLAEAAIRFHLTGDRTYRGFAPFILASGGAVATLSGTSEVEEDIPAHRRLDFGPAFAVGTGAGVDFFPSQRLALRAEIDYRLWKLETPVGLLPAGSGRQTKWSANTGISLGAAFHF